MRPGDVVVALGSSGLHSNGYSLARHLPAWVLGEIHRARDVTADPDAPRVQLRGEHPRF